VKKIPYTNNSKSIQHIGNKTIWPGQTREVDKSLLDLPGKDKAKNTDLKPVSNSIKDILKLSVSDFSAALPSLSTEDLDAVEAGEKAKSTPRVGAVNAVAAEKLTRASQSVEGDKSADEFSDLVKLMDDAELAEQDYPAESVYSAIVDEERQSREIIVFKEEYAAFDAEELESLKADFSTLPNYLTAIDELIAAKAEA